MAGDKKKYTISQLNANATDKGAPPPAEDSLWLQILSQASRSKPKESAKTVLVVGERQSGKTELVNNLVETTADTRDGVALEYFFLDVSAASGISDSNERIDLWILNGDPNHERLLEHVITPNTIDSLIVVVAIDFAKPWEMARTLERWTNTIEEYADMVWEELPEARKQAAQKKVATYIRRYRYTNGFQDKVNKMEDDDKGTDEAYLEENFPLGDGCLEKNFGVPLVFVSTRSDVLFGPEYGREFSLKQDTFDLVQKYIRRNALKYGASVLYTSNIKQESKQQFSILLSYLIHRLVGNEKKFQYEDANRETVFIPTGWDAATKIDGLHPNDGSLLANIFPLQAANKYKAPEATVTPTPDFGDFLAEEQKRLDQYAKSDPKMDNIRKEAQHALYSAGGKQDSFANSQKGMEFAVPDALPTTMGKPAISVSSGMSPSISISSSSAPMPSSASVGASGPPGVGAGGASGPKAEAAANFFKNILSSNRQPGAAAGVGGIATSGAVGGMDKREYLQKLQQQQAARNAAAGQ
eukprot:c2961_g1_i1.p1 GENE.c2961_g1_i1~~c2961_g1_i1.p1  ORF type:complete len:554 (+),score=164.14 c2961_g1_i1:82-1662(+)